jgi:rubrerythrin
MAGDPKLCRVQAASCRALAEMRAEQEREHLGVVARALEQLAVEHESAQAFLRTMDAINEALKSGCAVEFAPIAVLEDDELEARQRA